jgi:uncharacterized membrane protein
VESRRRTFAKACSWQSLGLVTNSALAFVLTGSLTAAGGFALATTLVGFVCYLLHERVWQLIEWGRGGGKGA